MQKAEEAYKAEEAQKCAKAEWKKWMEEVQVQHIRNQKQQYAWEQHEKAQKQAQAIMAKQSGGETSVAASAVTSGRPAPCIRCRNHLSNTAGCIPQVKLKAIACVPCQTACKSCSWTMAGMTVAEASTPGGSGMEASGKAVQKQMVKRRPRTATNVLLRGGEKWKKAHMTMEEGGDNEDNTEEVFGVPKAMVEQQHDTLGMLTKMLAQMEERMAVAVVEAREVTRAEKQERHMAVMEVAVLEHLALEWRRLAWEDERLEMERVCMEIKQQWVDNM